MISKTLLGLLLGLALLLLLLYLYSCKKRPAKPFSGESIKHNIEQWGETYSSTCASCTSKGCCSGGGETQKRPKHAAIEYYDDEELDAFAKRDGSDYTDEEQQQFRDIFFSLLLEDRKGWLKSLEKRHIVLPPSLQKEVEELLTNFS